MKDDENFSGARQAAEAGRYSYVENLLFGPGAPGEAVLGYGFSFAPGQEEALARLVRLANERLEQLAGEEVPPPAPGSTTG